MSATAMWSKTLLYNPFLYLAGSKSLVIGLVSILLLGFFSYISGTHYLGVVLPVFAKDAAFAYYLAEHFIHWMTLSLLLFISGVIFSKSRIRPVDVWGTQALALYPLMLVPILRLLPSFQSFFIFSVYTFILYGLHIIMAIWSITLMFNAYKVTCNVKKSRLIVSFVATILLAEILTIFLVYNFNNHVNL